MPGMVDANSRIAVPAMALGKLVAVLVAVAAYGTDWNAAAETIGIATDTLAHFIFGTGTPQYILSFEAVSVLLLAAVIGGVFLAKKEATPKDGGA